MALKSTTGICDPAEAAILSFLERRGLGTIKDALDWIRGQWTMHQHYRLVWEILHASTFAPL